MCSDGGTQSSKLRQLDPRLFNALLSEKVENTAVISRQLESIKHYLWHGNVDEALERLENLILDLDLISSSSSTLRKFKERIAEFDTYIRNNQEYIPNYGEYQALHHSLRLAIGRFPNR